MKKLILFIILIAPTFLFAQLQLPYGYKNINVTPSPVDYYYYNTSGTVYTNTAQVISQVTSGLRYIGQTFNVNGVEYWFTPTTADGNLVVKGGSGTVTTVTSTAPIVITSTPTTTPNVTITQATTSTNGYLSSTDWNTFNGKQASGSYAVTTNNLSDLSNAGTARTNLGLGTAATISSTAGGDLSGALPSPTVAKINGNTVPANASGVLTNNGSGTLTWASSGGSGTVTSVAASVPGFLSISGSPITTSGTLAISYSGTALPIANGGTGQTTANTAFNALAPAQVSNSGKVLSTDGTNTSWIAAGGTGTVTNFSVVTANGVSASVANPTTTPAATFTLGAITPTSVNGVTIGGTTTSSNLRTYLNRAADDNVTTLHFPGDATHVATLFNQIIELSDGRLMGFISQFGALLADFSQFTLSQSYSYDGGKSWSTPTTIVGIEGSEVANAIPSVWIQSNGTLVMLFWRQLGSSNPIQTSICKKTSTDNGATWSSTSTVYTVGTYSAPHGGRIFKANDGVLWYAFNEWIGGPTGLTDYQYGSQNANYKGQLLKSTDDGVTWTHPATNITDGTTNAVLEPGLFQYEDNGSGVIGRVTMYYRTRGNVVGASYSDDNLVTWTTGAATTLAGSNHDTHMVYDVSHDVIIAVNDDITPWDNRKINIHCSYDRGVTWYQKNIIAEVPSGYATAPGLPYIYKGNILFPFYKSNSAVTRYDEYVLLSSLSNFTGLNPTEKHTPIYSGETQTLLGATNIGTGMTLGDLIIGATSKFNSTDLLDVKKTGGDTRVILSNDDNNSFANTLINFRRTAGGSNAANTAPIGELRWNDKLSIIANQNNLGTNSCDLKFLTDTGSGLVGRSIFLNSGSWLYGDNLVALRVNDLATFTRTSGNTAISFRNADSNTNTNELYFQKQRASSFSLTAGDPIGQLSFNTLAYIKGEANSRVVSSFSNVDITFYTANSAQTVAKRVTISGDGAGGDLLIGSATDNARLYVAQSVLAATWIPAFRVDGAAHTGITASTEYTHENHNYNQSIQFATGALPLNRTVIFQPTTLTFLGSSTATDASNLTVTGATIAGGNGTITNTHGFLVQSAGVTNSGFATNSYGMTVNTMTGASNNYAAQFLGGNVGIGLSAPTAKLHVLGTTTLDGSVTLPTAGNKISIKTGTNAAMGTGTLVGGTATITTSACTTSSVILLGDTNTSVTNVGSLTYVRSSGSFVVTSTNVLDTSTFVWIIFEPAP